MDYPLTVARNGLEALSLLRGIGTQGPLPQPCLILLDLHMPQMNGFEFLQELRQDLILSASLVFVLTTSNDNCDKQVAYQHHVAGYLLKSELAAMGSHTAQRSARSPFLAGRSLAPRSNPYSPRAGPPTRSCSSSTSTMPSSNSRPTS
jgi:CheY-like chemotaxis protein